MFSLGLHRRYCSPGACVEASSAWQPRSLIKTCTRFYRAQDRSGWENRGPILGTAPRGCLVPRMENSVEILAACSEVNAKARRQL